MKNDLFYLKCGLLSIINDWSMIQLSKIAAARVEKLWLLTLFCGLLLQRMAAWEDVDTYFFSWIPRENKGKQGKTIMWLMYASSKIFIFCILLTVIRQSLVLTSNWWRIKRNRHGRHLLCLFGELMLYNDNQRIDDLWWCCIMQNYQKRVTFDNNFEWILGTARTQIPLLCNKLIGYQCFASIHKGYKRQSAKSWPKYE